VVADRGLLDVVVFDACNLGEWEVADMLAGQADVLVASQAWVGGEGLAYDQVFTELGALADGPAVGARLAWSAGVYDDELTCSAVDVNAAAALSDAVDALAGVYLEDPARLPDFVRARGAASGLDRQWEDW
jgi:hypothetical protein